MTDFRTSQTFVGVLADWDPQLRVSQHYVEVLLDADPQLRISQHFIEYLADNDPLLRVTQYQLEVLYSTSTDDLTGLRMLEGRPDAFYEWTPVEYGERWNA